MKFIKLESRGGNYLVVASNVAWLRTAENGQTSVGIIGGQPLLVVGSVEEVADKILKGLATGAEEMPAAEPVAHQAAPAPKAPVETEVPQQIEAAEPAPAPQAIALPEAQEPEVPETTAVPKSPAANAASKRQAPIRSASMWERPAQASPRNLKLKATSQRMMGMLE